MTDTNKERAEFEAWVRTQPGGTDYALNRRDFPDSDRIGEYVNPSVNFAWKALAALAAKAPAAPTQAEFALRALVAAGFVTQAKVDEAMTLPGAPPAAEPVAYIVRSVKRPSERGTLIHADKAGSYQRATLSLEPLHPPHQLPQNSGCRLRLRPRMGRA